MYTENRRFTCTVQCSKTRKLSCHKVDRAMRPIHGCPEIFCESVTTPTTTPKLLMGFCSNSVYKCWINEFKCKKLDILNTAILPCFMLLFNLKALLSQWKLWDAAENFEVGSYELPILYAHLYAHSEQKPIKNFGKSSPEHSQGLPKIFWAAIYRAHHAVICSIVTSRIDYCNSLYVGMSASNFNKLHRVQNTLARVVS